MKLKKYDYGFIGKRIQQARKAKHYTQEALAEKIDMSAKNLSQLECGMTGLSIPTLILLYNVLDISADYILFGNNEHQSNAISHLLSELPEKKQLQAEKILEIFVKSCNE